MISAKDKWKSRKLWLSVALIALATWAMVNKYIQGRDWLIFIGVVFGAWGYLQNSLDIHRVKLTAGPQGISIDNTDKGGEKQ